MTGKSYFLNNYRRMSARTFWSVFIVCILSGVLTSAYAGVNLLIGFSLGTSLGVLFGLIVLAICRVIGVLLRIDENLQRIADKIAKDEKDNIQKIADVIMGKE